MSVSSIASHFQEAESVLKQFQTEENFKKIEQAIQWMSQAIQHRGKIISCGNGGSMCDAMHFAEELTGRYRGNRPGIAAIAISDVSHISCVGNDYGYDEVFARQVWAFGQAGDVLIALSTSGKSRNILCALEESKRLGMDSICFLGRDGGYHASL